MEFREYLEKEGMLPPILMALAPLITAGIMERKNISKAINSGASSLKHLVVPFADYKGKQPDKTFIDPVGEKVQQRLAKKTLGSGVY